MFVIIGAVEGSNIVEFVVISRIHAFMDDENIFRVSPALGKNPRSEKDRLFPSRDIDCTVLYFTVLSPFHCARQ